MGVTIGGDTAKIVEMDNLLVIIRMRISQKIGLLNLANRNCFKKGNGYKIRTKSVRNYLVMCLILHTMSIYYKHTNSDLLVVWCIEACARIFLLKVWAFVEARPLMFPHACMKTMGGTNPNRT